MFKKKLRKTPPLTTFFIKLNVDKLSNWMNIRTKIAAVPKSEWGDVYTKEYKITLLPIEEFTFYHHETREFSAAIAGNDATPGQNLGSFEWEWNQRYFIAHVADLNEKNSEFSRVTVFAAPLRNIFDLLRNRENFSQNLRHNDGEVLELPIEDEAGYTQQVYKREGHWHLSFSNEIVELSISIMRASHIAFYD